MQSKVEKELQELGSRSWAEATTIVQDRDQWREWISSIFPTGEKGTDDSSDASSSCFLSASSGR